MARWPMGSAGVIRTGVAVAILSIALVLAGPEFGGNTGALNVSAASAADKPGPPDRWFTVGDAQYRLDPGDVWVRVPNGTYGDDPLMEFIGQTKDTWAIVYEVGSGWSLDRIVDFRRAEIRAVVEELDTEEMRTLLTDSMIPVSHVRYTGVLNGEISPTTWWTSSIVTDGGGVEVLASTTGGRTMQRHVEMLAKSLRVRLSGAE